MNRIARVLALSLVPLAFVGCETQDEIDQGGVILVVSDFDLEGLPAVMSASGSFPLVASGDATITLNSRPRNAGQPTSQLMDVIIEGYRVDFTRGDGGTRVPPALTEPVGGIAPTPGDYLLTGIFIMRRDQFETGPLRDLRDFGIDSETNSPQIRLVWHMTFFGRTVSGELVTSNTISFNLDVTP